MNLNDFYHYYKSKSGGGVPNFLKATEDFDSSIDWNKLPSTDAPTVSGGITDPNGGSDAQRINFTDNRQARVQQRVSLSASTQYTFSVYARVNTGTEQFRLRNVTLAEAEAKTATTSWTRFEYTFTTTTGGDYDLSIQNTSNDAKTIEFWGAMLNVGASANAYVKVDPSISGSTPTPAYSGFGDTYGDVTAYYSLRKFTEAETLNAIRVRRSSDDTEQDIGFDSNGDLDTTALTTFVNEDVNTYASDFTSGNEDLGESQGTGSDGQSIAGVDDAYKFTLNSANDAHYARVLGAFDLKNTYTVKLEYYIPSGQTVDTIDVRTGLITDGVYSQSVTDAWTSVTITDWSPTDSSPLRFYACDGATKIFAADGDVFYLKNISITQTTADGAVTTFYDQSGNGNNATNATATQQPLIVDGGSVVTENSKAAIEFDGVDDKLGFASNLNIGGSPSIIGVLNTAAGDAVWRAGGNDYWYFQASQIFRYRNGDFDATWVNSDGLPIVTGSQKLVATYKNSTSVQLAVDGTSIATKSSGTGTDGAFNYIGSDALNMDGVYQELIIFNSDQSSNRTGIETNINDHFDIYP